MNGKICPVMTLVSGFFEQCAGEQCAWWDAALECCGVVKVEPRFWLTPKGQAVVDQEAARPVRQLSDYLT